MKHEKRVGPRIVPWNTDISKAALSESVPFTSTLCVLLER